MGAVGAIASIGQTVLGAFGQYTAGKAAKEAGEYNEAVAKNNAIIAGRSAADAIKRGKASEAAHRKKVGLVKGKQRAAAAKSGVVLDQGTSLDILLESAELGEFDALTIRANAEREAGGFRTKAMNFEATAGLAKARGQSAYRAGLIGAGGTILGGAAKLAPVSGAGAGG